jgi:hypothetical protein
MLLKTPETEKIEVPKTDKPIVRDTSAQIPKHHRIIKK